MLPACPSEEELVIRFVGKLDTATCQELESELRDRLAGSGATVVFDLAKVDFVCSWFLRLCIHAGQQTGPRGFRVVNVSPSIKKVFKIAGLDAMLESD
ncbi:MAG: STAS domain-containing protein [Thermoguttaceae bacterium]|jgi:anti-anti-sigma factor|nr:STAS domain-containing protein [Thermoguttaceae bacterium]